MSGSNHLHDDQTYRIECSSHLLGIRNVLDCVQMSLQTVLGKVNDLADVWASSDEIHGLLHSRNHVVALVLCLGLCSCCLSCSSAEPR